MQGTLRDEDYISGLEEASDAQRGAVRCSQVASRAVDVHVGMADGKKTAYMRTTAVLKQMCTVLAVQQHAYREVADALQIREPHRADVVARTGLCESTCVVPACMLCQVSRGPPLEVADKDILVMSTTTTRL